MFRKSLVELMELLLTYYEVLTKEEIAEIKKYQNDPKELKIIIKKLLTRVNSISLVGCNSERFDRVSTLRKILIASDAKIKS